MKTLFLALAGAAVALTAGPAEARHYGHHWARGHMSRTVCTRHRHRTTCTTVNRGVRPAAAGYRVGYNFGPNYQYVDYNALPQPVVTRYHLGQNFRYVNDNGYVYVVNPNTYRVVRVITVP